MKNLGQMMKQAQQMQEQMAEIQSKLADEKATGTSGGGMVEITVSGKHEALNAKIDPSLFSENESEVLEDLIVAAINDANTKIENRVKEKMSNFTGGLQLPPGLKLPF